MRGANLLVFVGVLVLALSGETVAAGQEPPGGGAPDVVVEPGTDLQRAVDGNPAGTDFLLEAGVYRMQEVVPKSGDTFTGEPGAVLDGSRPLTEFKRQGRLWVAARQKDRNMPHGYCETGSPRCRFAEIVFFDGVPLTHAASKNKVGPGSYYFDYKAGKIYVAQDPVGHEVEVAASDHAFSAEDGVDDVAIRGLTVEKYANPAQHGAIQAVDGNGWVIESNEVRLNHGAGIIGGEAGRVRDNHVHHNGQLGVAGLGADLLVEGNEISYNNTAGFDPAWEAGGTKFVLTEDLMVRDNRVHHNNGPGLWTDIDNIRTTYEGNTVTDNDDAGIFHEISHDAVIRDNTVERNGADFDVWLWGAQVQIAGSRNVEVTNNTVVVGADGGNGIALIQQKRGSGEYGPWKTHNNWVHHNDVTYLGEPGASGAVADHDEAGMLSGDNRFDHNSYHSSPRWDRSWFWGEETDWTGLQDLGQERNGTTDLTRTSIP